MIIERQYKVWFATMMGKDVQRPSLDYVKVVRVGEEFFATGGFINNYPQDDVSKIYDGVAVATNGFILAAVPVVMGEGDVDGLVHFSHIKKAFAPALRKYGDPSVELGEEYVTLADGSFAPRFIGSVDSGTAFPDVSVLLPGPRPYLDANHGVFRIDAVEMDKVTKAIASKCRGSDSKVRMILMDNTNASPILVEPYHKKVRDRVGLPLGLQMPLVSNGDDYAAWVLKQAKLLGLEEEG